MERRKDNAPNCAAAAPSRMTAISELLPSLLCERPGIGSQSANPGTPPLILPISFVYCKYNLRLLRSYSPQLAIYAAEQARK